MSGVDSFVLLLELFDEGGVEGLSVLALAGGWGDTTMLIGDSAGLLVFSAEL